MKSRLLLAFLALILLSTFSCTKVIMLLVGAHPPEYKSDAEVIKYTKKIFDHEGDIFRISHYAEGSAPSFTSRRIPSLMYADNGELYEYPIVSCADGYKLIKKVEANNFVSQVDSTYIIREIKENLYSIEGKEVSIEDKTFVVFYSRFAGNLNKSQALMWMEEIENTTDKTYVLVNCDFSEK